jgi:hypothetical protein
MFNVYIEELKKLRSEKDIQVEGEMKVCMKKHSLSFTQVITKITKI